MNSEESNHLAEKFGRRLRMAFDGASNAEIARKLNVTKSTIGNYMDGRIPPAETLIEISRLTSCSLHWLITGEGERHISVQVGRDDSAVSPGDQEFEARVRAIVSQELARAFQQFAQSQSAQTVITNTTNANFRFTNQR
jgi:transcriptional regulator with XRE-family HTH domain